MQQQEKDHRISMQAKSDFKITTWDHKPYDETEEGPKLSRVDVKKSIKGDVEAESTAILLMCQADDGSVPKPVGLWQQSVHEPGIYDLEVDTSKLSPEESAEVIRLRLRDGPPPSAFRRLAAMADG